MFDVSGYEQPAEERARLYCRKRRALIVDQPGQDGNDGSVYATDRFTVVKALDRRRGYHLESEAYHRLEAHNVETIQGHHVPRLLGWDDDLGVIEISVVTRPFVLDFGKIRLDERLEEVWPEAVLVERWTYWESLFEPHQWPTVLAIFGELGRRYGIWIEDLHPGNIGFAEDAARL